MKNELPPQEKDNHFLWRYIYLAKYTKPAEAAIEAVRKGIMGLWDSFRRPSSPQGTGEVKPNLRSIPPHQLNQIARGPNWNEAAPALDKALRDWLESDNPEIPRQIIVGAPYSGTYQAVIQWASAGQWRIIAPLPCNRC